jgi:hypothetical protein
MEIIVVKGKLSYKTVVNDYFFFKYVLGGSCWGSPTETLSIYVDSVFFKLW